MSSLTSIDFEIGRRLNARRIWMGVGVNDLAASVGGTRDQIEACERGERRPSAIQLMRLSEALAVRVTYFYVNLLNEPDDPFNYVPFEDPTPEEVMSDWKRLWFSYLLMYSHSKIPAGKRAALILEWLPSRLQRQRCRALHGPDAVKTS